jgi:hypothetical protein
MLPLLHGISGLLFLALALPPSVMAQETRVVTGVVVDAESGVPVADALVTIRGTDLRAITDPEGRFEVGGVPVGSLQLVLRHVGYGEHAQPLVVGASGPLDFRIRVSSRAIELAPLVVEVASGDALAQRASGTATNVIDRATIDAFALSGQGLLPLLASRVPNLRVIDACVEYRLQVYAAIPDPVNPELLITRFACRDITVYVDGMPSQQGSALLQSLSPQDVERIQVLSPGEAGVRYADAGRGVILVETRRGTVTETPYRVHVNGFGWNEPPSYRWLRVLGVSALGNAAVAGLTSRAVFDCGGEGGGEVWLTPPRCHATAGIAAAVLTSAISRVFTRRAGRTPYSEGRTYPAFLIGAATASVGYLLYLRGENEDSDTSRAAGQIVLAVGIPLTLTLSDRVFRVLR